MNWMRYFVISSPGVPTLSANLPRPLLLQSVISCVFPKDFEQKSTQFCFCDSGGNNEQVRAMR